MIKKVPSKKLKVGMFLEKIDAGWFSTPFIKSQFKITSQSQIKKILDYGITEVFIDTGRGFDIAEDVEGSQAGKVVVEYIEVTIGRFVLNTILPFDIFTKKENEYSVYLRKTLPFHAEVLNFLENNGIKSVYLDARDKELLEKYGRETQKERDLSAKCMALGFETDEKVKRYNDYMTQYMPVESSIFFPGVITPINLYTEEDTLVRMILQAEKAIPEDQIFARGANDGIRRNVLIDVKDKERYKSFLKDLTSGDISGGGKDSSELRMAVLKENSKIVTKDLMENPRSGETVKNATNAVEGMIQNIIENPTSFYGLMKISTYDYYTYLHSVNVCTLAIGLSMALGVDKKELFPLAIGTLMHDVGKSKVPNSLINKPGKLTDKEFDLIKSHVNWGSELLKDHKDLPPDAFLPLSQHHEKLSGRGYPNKLEGDEVHFYGRISSIVDVYDALTTERAYKKAFKPFDAVSILAKDSDSFDRKIFKEFVGMLGKQAAGG